MQSPQDERVDLSALSAWAPQLAEAFVSLASDIALVLDQDGVILNVAQGGATPLAPTAHEWVGRAWIDTVTGETRAKVGLLLKDVVATGYARRREVNHPSPAGSDIPVAYTAMRLGERGPLLVVGRDLRAVAAIQQRFVDVQREMERGYWRTRQSEARYRLLFQVATDAVMVVDAESLLILEANDAAAALFDMAAPQLPGRPVTHGFDHRSRGAVEELLVTTRRLGRPAEIRARLNGKVTATHVAATPFRADDTMRLLVRVRPLNAGSTPGAPGTHESPTDRSATLARLVDAADAGIVVTDSSGRVLAANPAFLALIQADAEVEIKGRSLQHWLVDPGPPFEALIPRVQREGMARRRPCSVRRAGAAPAAVEVSATLLAEGDQECIGFTIQPAAHPAPAQAPGERLGAAVERLVGKLGELPLPVVLREVAAMVERQIIERAAHDGTDDTATAATLGISSTSLRRRRRRLGGDASASKPPP
jgi:transcriptional regulator PpsR